MTPPAGGDTPELDREAQELTEAGANQLPTVGLLGTGIMGHGMGRSIQRAGLPLVVWNRTPANAQPLIDEGATLAGSPEEAAAAADLLVTMLTDADTTEDVARQALPGLRDGGIWVQMATIGVAGTERMVKLAVEHGAALIDAPVSGTKQPAEQGKLVVLASGAPVLRATVAPLFDAVGSRTIWVDEHPGGGTRLKLVVNDWLCSLLGGLAEAIVLAELLDLDPRLFLDAIEGGPLGAPYAGIKGDLMIERSYPAAFPAQHAAKDVRLVLEAAAAAGVELPVTSGVDDLFRRVLDAGRGEEDMSVLIEGLRTKPGDG